jgi:hypothetical protein
LFTSMDRTDKDRHYYARQYADKNKSYYGNTTNHNIYYKLKLKKSKTFCMLSIP